jgi:predicted 3-demethylubiquinone-9 3-methyltransferase (glyoxalase superfamily)
MTASLTRIVPCLWFDDQAEAAVSHYTAIFPGASIGRTTRYTKQAAKAAGRKEGSVMTIEFQLDGQRLTALNGGPVFKFNEAVSLAVHCDTQESIDYFWSRLSEGGDPKAQQCGWLKDRFGLSWQVVPEQLVEWMHSPDPGVVERVTAAMLQMKKFDIEGLRRAAEGS